MEPATISKTFWLPWFHVWPWSSPLRLFGVVMGLAAIGLTIKQHGGVAAISYYVEFLLLLLAFSVEYMASQRLASHLRLETERLRLAIQSSNSAVWE